MQKKYAYHRMLLCLLGGKERKSIRNKSFLGDINAVMTELVYAEALRE